MIKYQNKGQTKVGNGTSDLNSESGKSYSIHLRIKTEREKLNLSHEQLGNKVGVSASAIAKWEKSTIPKTKSIQKLADVFKCTFEDLLTGKSYLFEPESKSMVVSAPDPPVYKGSISLADGIKMATDVLNSGTTYARALYMNIVHFDAAIKAEERAARYQIEMKGQSERINGLEKEQFELKKQIFGLMDQLKNHVYRHPLGEILMDDFDMPKANIAKALDIQKENKDKRLGEILIEMGVLSEKALQEALDRQRQTDDNK